MVAPSRLKALPSSVSRDSASQGPAAERPTVSVAAGTHPRYASLDLLRALAIVLVVNCHSASAFAVPPLAAVLQLGGKGVELFFVLSGWLLGRQLMLELQRTGRIDLFRFWSRRWLRTLPAYYAVLAVVSIWLLFRGTQPLRAEYLFFGQTYFTSMPYFGISWSLCVEEHFYLLVAPTLWGMWRYPAARWLAPALVLMPTLCRVMGWFGAEYQTHVWYDACAVGVLLAGCSVAYPETWHRVRGTAKWIALATLLVVAKDVAIASRPTWRDGLGPVATNYGLLTYAVIFGTWIWAAAVQPHWLIGRLPGVKYVAERSYAIYLLHLEVVAAVRYFQPLPFILSLCLIWIGTTLAAELLYRLIERPGMRIRELFAATQSRSAGI